MSFKSSAYVLVVVDTVRSFEISCNRTLTEYWEISTCLSSHLLYISNRFNIDLNRLLVCFLTLEVHLRETYSEVGRGGPVLFNVLSLTLTLTFCPPSISCCVIEFHSYIGWKLVPLPWHNVWVLPWVEYCPPPPKNYVGILTLITPECNLLEIEFLQTKD